jgi:hypothetical protein
VSANRLVSKRLQQIDMHVNTIRFGVPTFTDSVNSRYLPMSRPCGISSFAMGIESLATLIASRLFAALKEHLNIQTGDRTNIAH